MSVPVILRPNKGSDPLTYTLIGECYLHTMMDSRAIDVQEERLKHLKASMADKGAQIAELELKVASSDASEQDRSDLRQYKQDLENDSAELASLTPQSFELR